MPKELVVVKGVPYCIGMTANKQPAQHLPDYIVAALDEEKLTLHKFEVVLSTDNRFELTASFEFDGWEGLEENLTLSIATGETNWVLHHNFL